MEQFHNDSPTMVPISNKTQILNSRKNVAEINPDEEDGSRTKLQRLETSSFVNSKREVCSGDKSKQSKTATGSKHQPWKQFAGKLHIKKPFKCDYCGKGFFEQHTLIAHSDTHNRSVGHPCETCGKKFQRLSNLNDHKRIHTGEKPFVCDICGRSFSQSGNLHSHVRTVHAPRSERQIQPPRSKPKPPENELKVTPEELIQASLAGQPKGEETFVCTICGYRFGNGATLLAHYRIHLGEKPYQCDICGRGYMMMTHLKTHPCIHNGAFKCSKCEKIFKGYKELNKHLRTNNDPYIHKCQYCPKSFNTVCGLHFHLLKHNLKSCDGCERRFVRQKSLEEHQLNDHAENELKFKTSEETSDKEGDDV